ncbi:OmpH family outer membrane protein [Putridiphycobacter roseus]|uniref:OmpH family outer membrane protein n=1 Tax=Putridiphycobacter roseus TaxID=2219161 RepID=A0A2W1NS94_9FLAO|nr:OmpH family outer membrane protein [Putridiphycobacter roseus]PZE18522.1 OmpH family outer membrane protein [Putridiphycobacter roseus]
MNTKIIILIVAFLGSVSFGYGQRYAYVDTQYILDNIPEYKESQTKLDEFAIKWQEEIEAKYALIDSRKRALQAEEILLPEEIKKDKEKDILKLENEAKELQKKYFGVNGQLFQKRGELIKPIQDKIFKAIQEVSDDKKYAFVFDKANQSTLLFADPKYNISDLVLRNMDIEVDSK